MIVALAGRRIDAPDTKSKRFPPEYADSVKQKLKDCFISVNAVALVCSGACGSDLLAIQAAEESGIDRTVILPFDHDLFRATSVVDRPGDWGRYYDLVIAQLKGSDKLIELVYQADDPEVYLKTNIYILDQAKKLAAKSKPENNRAIEDSNSVLALIVWEGKPKDSDDTTYHFYAGSKKKKIPGQGDNN